MTSTCSHFQSVLVSQSGQLEAGLTLKRWPQHTQLIYAGIFCTRGKKWAFWLEWKPASLTFLKTNRACRSVTEVSTASPGSGLRSFQFSCSHSSVCTVLAFMSL